MCQRLALVGVGKWGANFLRTIVNAHEDKLAIVVSSQSKEQLNAIAVSNARVLSDVSLIDSYIKEIDGVIVATQPDIRPAIVEKILKHGLPVIAEKPLSLDADKSKRLIRLAQEKGLFLIEDFIHLFSWPYLKLREQLSHKLPKNIVSEGRGWGPFRDYSALLDYAPHDLAMTLQAFCRYPDNAHLELADYKDPLSFTAKIKLEFGKHGTANITISNVSQHKVRSFRVDQNNTYWLYDDTSQNKLIMNGCPQSSIYSNLSPMELLLDYFCGRKQLYGRNELLWLSQAVAEVIRDLERQYLAQLKQYH